MILIKMRHLQTVIALLLLSLFMDIKVYAQDFASSPSLILLNHDDGLGNAKDCQEAVHLSTFDRIFSRIATIEKTPVVAESYPLKSKLSLDEINTLSAELTTQDISDVEVINQIAAAFDYDVIRDRSFLLLVKRYSSPDDMPYVGYNESVRSLHAIYAFLGLISSSDRTSECLGKFARAITSDQAGQLKSGITYADLTSEQQALFHNYLIQNYLGDSTPVLKSMMMYLEGIKSKDAVFRWFNLDDSRLRVFGYEGPLGYPGHVEWGQYALSGGLRASLPDPLNEIPKSKDHQAVGQYNLSFPSNSPPQALNILKKYEELAINGVLPDATAPGPADYLPVAPLPDCVITLGAAATQVGKHTGDDISIDSDLAAKPLSIFGADGLSAPDFLHAVVDIYGGKILHPKDNVYSLTLPFPPQEVSVSNTAEMLRMCWPKPWQRFLSRLSATETADLVESERKTNLQQNKNFNESAALQANEFQGQYIATNTFFDSAVHRLRVLVQPKVELSPNKQIFMNDMGEEERRLMAFLCALSLTRQINTLAARKNLPGYVANIEKMSVAGTISPAGTPGRQYQLNFFEKVGEGQYKVYIRTSGGLP